MPAPKTIASADHETLKAKFDYQHGFALRSFRVSDGWCGGYHPLLGVREASLLSAITGDPSCVYETLENALFLDTETTGLGYGAGTFAFLVGIAYRRPDGWIGEQLFVSTPGEERAMLAYLKNKVEGASALVTYNGKSFDLPLLRCRYALNHVSMKEPRIHFDLYHMARPILKDRLPRRRLVDLEQSIFGQHRSGDIEGADIPDAYFRFLHRGEIGDVSRVLTHNELDVLTMPRLLSWLVDGISTSFEAPQDELCFLERCALKGGAVDLIPRLEQLQERAVGDIKHRLALLKYGLLKQLDLCTALGALRKTYGDARGTLRSKMARRLAIHYEHDMKDFRQALDFAQDTETEEGWYAHRKRVDRLQRKLCRLR